MKIDKKIIVNALIALVVYAAVMGLVKGGSPAVHWTFDFCTDSTGYELCDQFS